MLTQTPLTEGEKQGREGQAQSSELYQVFQLYLQRSQTWEGALPRPVKTMNGV